MAFDGKDVDGPLPCENVAEFVLAWRAIGIGLVYFRDPKIRAQVLDLSDLCHRAWTRLVGSIQGSRDGRVWFPQNEVAGIVLVPTEDEDRSESFGRADRDVKWMGSMASKQLFELDDAADAADAADADGRTQYPDGSQIPYERMN